MHKLRIKPEVKEQAESILSALGIYPRYGKSSSYHYPRDVGARDIETQLKKYTKM
jgi:hypothetical protein